MAGVVEDVRLVDIAGHTYRLRSQPIAGARGSHAKQHHHPQHLMDEVEEELQILTLEDEAADDDPLVTQSGDGFVTQLSVDPQLLPFIIGRGGNIKKQIEQETGATLVIPKGGPHKPPPPHQPSSKQQQQQLVVGSAVSEPITIKGSSRQAVSSACVRTQLLIDGVLGSKMLDYTHFVSIPLANQQATQKLQQFRDQVLGQADASDKGLEASIFINPEQLHLTLLMLKLYSDDARQRAAGVLRGLKQQVQQLLAGQPLRLSLRGLDYMSDDPTDMHVLYLKVNELGGSQKLSALCDMVLKGFEEAGLMQPGQHKQVKLHATIINTRHRHKEQQQQQQPQQQQQQQPQQQQQQQRGKQQWPERKGFDGRQLLQDWGDLDLGEWEVPALHISQRGVYDKSSGYYVCFEALQLTQ